MYELSEWKDGLQGFLATNTIQVSPLTFFINLLLAAVLSFVHGEVYVRFGNSLTNRRMFSRNFILLAMVTTMIITIIKFTDYWKICSSK